MVKTRRSTPHAGGRPLLFIPIAVVERACELARQGYDFSSVVRVLEREGNGAWPRKTLLRRVRSTARSSTPARGQNRRRCRAAAGDVEQLERVDKTPAGPTRWARLEAAAQAAEYDTPAYHEAIRAMHASPDNPLAGGVGGPCGCYSCSPSRRRRAA